MMTVNAPAYWGVEMDQPLANVAGHPTLEDAAGAAIAEAQANSSEVR